MTTAMQHDERTDEVQDLSTSQQAEVARRIEAFLLLAIPVQNTD